MTITNDTDVYYDPYDVDIAADPYPTYARLRDEAPIYYNERYDFWALSRHSDVEQALANWETFSNSRSDILELDQVRIRHAQRRDDVRGSARAHDAARADVPGVHPAPDGRDRRPDPAVLHRLPGSAGRFGRIRHHRRARVDDADAGDRHAAGNPGVRTDLGARRQRRQPAHQARHPDEGRRRRPIADGRIYADYVELAVPRTRPTT